MLHVITKSHLQLLRNTHNVADCCTSCRETNKHRIMQQESVTVDFTGGRDTRHVLWLCGPIGQRRGRVLGSKVVADDVNRTEKGEARGERLT